MSNIHPGFLVAYALIGAIFSFYADVDQNRSVGYSWFAFFFWPLIALKSLLKGAWEFITEW